VLHRKNKVMLNENVRLTKNTKKYSTGKRKGLKTRERFNRKKERVRQKKRKGWTEKKEGFDRKRFQPSRLHQWTLSVIRIIPDSLFALMSFL